VQSATVLHNLSKWKSSAAAPTDLGFLCYACPSLAGMGPKSDMTGSWALNSAYRGKTRPALGHVPFTKIEAQLIEKLFGQRMARLYTDTEATETNVRAESGKARPRYLHFAAHGILNEREPRFSGLVLSMGSGALDDGFLEMREIFDLKFNADLVVLSACQSGLGKMVRGEGILGLTRAFMYAGSPSVIVSLWPVSDRSTCLLMQRFYRELLSGQKKSVALRKAKLWLMKSGGMDEAEATTRGVVLPRREGPQKSPYAHAYHWAPFVLIGLD